MLDTPRTTLVAAVVQEGRAHWVHCGDSRLYVVRAGDLLTRTRDHSYLELRNAAIPGLERVNRNVLFTCLGSPTKPIYDLSGPVLLEQGDRILLCSDGLWGALDDDAIVRGLGRTESISDDVFESTIQAEPLDGFVDDLDDEAIERSIAEINEAIRRSASRKP
jgi:serine/threonine protein phosphatase PrpC